jgi:hypothetical protein
MAHATTVDDALRAFNVEALARDALKLARDETLDRAVLAENERIDRDRAARDLAGLVAATREQQVSSLRARLLQQSVAASGAGAASARKAALDSLRALDAAVAGVRAFAVEPSAIDRAWRDGTAALLAPDVLPGLPAVSVAGALVSASDYAPDAVRCAGVAEMSLRERCRVVVEVKDLCDEVRRRPHATPERASMAEELVRDSMEIALQVPVAATLTLIGARAELQHFLASSPQRLAHEELSPAA